MNVNQVSLVLPYYRIFLTLSYMFQSRLLVFFDNVV